MNKLIKVCKAMGYEICKKSTYEYHIFLDNKLAFRVWTGKKEKWYSQKYDYYDKGYKKLIEKIGEYYLNFKEV